MEDVLEQVWAQRQALIDAVRQAGSLLLTFRPDQVHRQQKPDDSPVTEADWAVDESLQQALRALFPHWPVCSEERLMEWENEGPQANAHPFWLLDPVDGTRDFLAGRQEFCICLALMMTGKPVFALIGDPCRQRVFFAGSGKGAWLMDEQGGRALYLDGTSPEALTVACSHSKSNVLALEAFCRIHVQPVTIVKMGSALKFCTVALGEVDAYLRFRPFHTWDAAAGVLLVEESGGHCRTIKGDMLSFDPPRRLIDGMLCVGQRELAPHLLESLSNPLLKG
jgi:3'(2'), 5'-bisphosphate nucleotidase